MLKLWQQNGEHLVLFFYGCLQADVLLASFGDPVVAKERPRSSHSPSLEVFLLLLPLVWVQQVSREEQVAVCCGVKCICWREPQGKVRAAVLLWSRRGGRRNIPLISVRELRHEWRVTSKQKCLSRAQDIRMKEKKKKEWNRIEHSTHTCWEALVQEHSGLTNEEREAAQNTYTELLGVHVLRICSYWLLKRKENPETDASVSKFLEQMTQIRL